MRHDIVPAPEAVDDFRRLQATIRSAVRDAMETHLHHQPTTLSRSRIKRLRGVEGPQYRIRVGDVRVFYDVTGATVEVLAIVPKSEAEKMPKSVRKKIVREAALSDVKDDLSRYLREAERRAILITRHGKPAGVLIGFASEDDWFDYRLENDPRFAERVRRARASLRSGRGTKLEELE
jgi:prevent-host-death family protein